MEASSHSDGGPRGEQAAAISNDTGRLMREYTGRGPTKARTTISEDKVTALLRDTLTTGERKLVEAGKEPGVLGTRHECQEAMSADLVATVEKHTSRKVVGFMSANHVDPDLAVEIFVLAPRDG